MKNETRLPRNGKEGALYGGIICFLTSLFMSSFSIITVTGEFNGEIAMDIIKIWPIMFVIAMVIEPVLVGRIAENMVKKFTQPTDSFNAKILFRIVFTVFGMSMCMTFIGGIIGNGFNSDTFSNFISYWPRNFFIVLIAESLVIQPLARMAMVKIHANQDKKDPEVAIIK
ncbi:DUF2798 domain-containing protein [Peribacillus sp. NPDC097264]|uniref:DUF2798 domain-containing protein n=1 Tax=Peribacillus sp. NPDC097264 TaxID=3390616 RepID=UPI003D038A18